MKETDQGVKWFNTVYHPKMRKARSVLYEDGVLPRLRAETITLFTPWGPRGYTPNSRGSEVKDEDPEVKLLEFLAGILDAMKTSMPGKSFRWIFVGADTYGAEINNLPADQVSAYFRSLKYQIRQAIPEAEFHLWSEFSDLAEPKRREVDSNFDKFADTRLIERAKHTAASMGRGADWRPYLIERFSEAIFVEERWKPIKVSCAPRFKDDKVDLNLPRLYFVPEELQVPWLK